QQGQQRLEIERRDGADARGGSAGARAPRSCRRGENLAGDEQPWRLGERGGCGGRTRRAWMHATVGPAAKLAQGTMRRTAPPGTVLGGCDGERPQRPG
ncbi:unnamed protein product, partial [Urochloa humidicola]